jgi:hypothetical protein
MVLDRLVRDKAIHTLGSAVAAEYGVRTAHLGDSLLAGVNSHKSPVLDRMCPQKVMVADKGLMSTGKGFHTEFGCTVRGREVDI